MGRAYYRFVHDLALRLSNGQAFALRDAELGATFASGSSVRGSSNGLGPTCFLRGNFTAATYRALTMRGVVPPNRELQALAQPVSVQLNLLAELAISVAQDATTLSQWGRRLDQNSLTDAVARKLLTFDVWRLVSVSPLGQQAVALVHDTLTRPKDAAQEAYFAELVSELSNGLLQAVEDELDDTSPPALEEVVKLFFSEIGWQWEEVAGVEGLLRTVYNGQNGTWMCYTRILEGMGQVIFYSACPIPIPESAMPSLCEYVCRVNAELSLGNFEIDFDHASMRFRTSIDVTDVGLTTWLFRNLVFQNLAVMDVHLPELLSMMAGKAVLSTES